MANTTGSAKPLTFTLGGFALDTFEVPEEIEIGHEVQMAVHKFIDETGQPVKHVHGMGAFPIATQWSGELYGATAFHRHYIFDNICTQQQQIEWVLGPLKFQVFVKKYSGKVRHDKLVVYTLELEIIEDNNGAAQSLDTTAQAAQAMDKAYADGGNAFLAANAVTTVQIPSDISIAQSAMTKQVASLQPFRFASTDQLQALLTQVASFNNSLQQYLAPLGTSALLADAMQSFLNLTQSLNSYSLFAQNLSQMVGSPVVSNVQKQYQAGTSLFAVAAEHYPSQDVATTAQAIAQANGLTSLFLNASQTVKIPPLFR